MLEKIIVSAIAVNQLFLGVLWLAVGISVVFAPLFFFFGVWGIVNALVLFCGGLNSRVTALVWHVLFVGYIFTSLANGQKGGLFAWWAMIDLAAIVYLAKVIVHNLRDRKKPQPGSSIG